jgi:hypothetical protein
MGNMASQYLSQYLPTTAQHRSTTDNPVLPEVAQSQHLAAPRRLTIEEQSSLITFPTDGATCPQPLNPAMLNMKDSSQTHAESSVPVSTTEMYDLYEYIRYLQGRIEKHKARYSRHEQQYQDSYKLLQVQNEELQLQLVHARQECEKLQVDNVQLREHINNTRGSKPVHADDKYVTLIEHLNEKTKSWIAGLSKSGEAGDIQDEMGVVFEALGKTTYGRSVLETLGGNTHVLVQILGDRRRRMALVRQLLWMEITESVIQPFSFGLADGYNNILAKAVTKMIEQGIPSVSLVTHS